MMTLSLSKQRRGLKAYFSLAVSLLTVVLSPPLMMDAL